VRISKQRRPRETHPHERRNSPCPDGIHLRPEISVPRLVQLQSIGVFTSLDEEIACRIDDPRPVRGVIHHCHQREQKPSRLCLAVALILHGAEREYCECIAWNDLASPSNSGRKALQALKAFQAPFLRRQMRLPLDERDEPIGLQTRSERFARRLTAPDGRNYARPARSVTRRREFAHSQVANRMIGRGKRAYRVAP